VPPYWFIVRWEIGHAFYVIGFENIRIHPSRPHVIGFVAYLFFSTLESGFIFSGFAVEFAGYVWTVAVSGKKKLRIRKYPDTCRRGLNPSSPFKLSSIQIDPEGRFLIGKLTIEEKYFLITNIYGLNDCHDQNYVIKRLKPILQKSSYPVTGTLKKKQKKHYYIYPRITE